MFLSFVIPLYNCELYIAGCLESILSCQLPLKEYEIIVIDDGSRDNGANIVKSYQIHHDNVIIFLQENKGASSARNVGIKKAQGEYIWFVDADDRIDVQVLDVIYDRYKDDKTIELFCFNHTSVNNESTEYIEEFKEIRQFDGCSYIEFHPYYYLWNKIFRKESICHISFPEGTKNTEDWYFDNVTIINMNRIVGFPVNGYFYNTANMSSTLRTRTAESIKSNRRDTQRIHELTLKFIQELDDKRKIKAIRSALNYSIAGFFYAQFVDRVKVRDLKKIVKKYKENGLYPIPQTHSRRANKFLVLANKPILFYAVAYLHRIFHKRS